MKNLLEISLVVVMLFLSIFAVNTFAAEVKIEKEEVSVVAVTEKIIQTADNFIVMFDSSSSMKKSYKNTNLTRYEAAIELLKEKNEMLPDLGYMGGLYLFTPFKAVYAMQPYDREKFAKAIEQLPPGPKGPTLLQQGLHKLDKVLAGLSGETVVFLFTDGTYSDMSGSKKPWVKAKELAEKYDVCFFIVSLAEGDLQKKILKAVASVNECSRVVPFELVFANPVYLAGALFVIDTEAIPYVSTLERVADFEINHILFDFDRAEVRPDKYQELNELGKFLQDNPKTYTVLTGFADSFGPAEYNLGLSRRRAESVQAYLIANFKIGIGRIVTQWYGELDPVAGNDTPEGRQQNRRVECLVMGLD